MGHRCLAGAPSVPPHPLGLLPCSSACGDCGWTLAKGCGSARTGDGEPPGRRLRAQPYLHWTRAANCHAQDGCPRRARARGRRPQHLQQQRGLAANHGGEQAGEGAGWGCARPMAAPGPGVGAPPPSVVRRPPAPRAEAVPRCPPRLDCAPAAAAAPRRSSSSGSSPTWAC